MFVQAEVLKVHSIGNTSNKETDEGSKKEKVETEKVFPLSRNKDKTQECIVALQFMLTTELDDVKNPSLPCESLHPGFHSLLT